MGGIHPFLMDFRQLVYNHPQDIYKGGAVDRTLLIAPTKLLSLDPLHQLCLTRHRLCPILLTHSVVMKIKIPQNVVKVQKPIMREIKKDLFTMYVKWNSNLKD